MMMMGRIDNSWVDPMNESLHARSQIRTCTAVNGNFVRVLSR